MTEILLALVKQIAQVPRCRSEIRIDAQCMIERGNRIGDPAVVLQDEPFIVERAGCLR